MARVDADGNPIFGTTGSAYQQNVDGGGGYGGQAPDATSGVNPYAATPPLPTQQPPGGGESGAQALANAALFNARRRVWDSVPSAVAPQAPVAQPTPYNVTPQPPEPTRSADPYRPQTPGVGNGGRLTLDGRPVVDPLHGGQPTPGEQIGGIPAPAVPHDVPYNAPPRVPPFNITPRPPEPYNVTPPPSPQIDPPSAPPGGAGQPQSGTGSNPGAPGGAFSPYQPAVIGGKYDYNAQQIGPSSAGYNISNVGAPPTPDAYAQALKQSFQPYFDESQQNLSADLAAKGIMTSGAGVKEMQDLTAKNNATYASALAPLIQQGYGQQFSANTQNAAAQTGANRDQFQTNEQRSAADVAAQNRAREFGIGNNFAGDQFNANNINGASRGAFDANVQSGLMTQGNVYNAQESNAQRQQQLDMFNATRGDNIYGANADRQNQYNLASMGYGNQNYQNAMREFAGLNATGLSSQGNALSQGMQNAFNGWQRAGENGAASAGQMGYNRGYGAGGGGGAGGNGGYDPAAGYYTDPNVYAGNGFDPTQQQYDPNLAANVQNPYQTQLPPSYDPSVGLPQLPTDPTMSGGNPYQPVG